MQFLGCNSPITGVINEPHIQACSQSLPIHPQQNLLLEKVLQTRRDPGKIQQGLLLPPSLEKQSWGPLELPAAAKEGFGLFHNPQTLQKFSVKEK